MTIFRTQWFETAFVRSFKIYISHITEKMIKQTRLSRWDLNSKFSEVLSNDGEQSIDEHMVKFKIRSGMKQCIKSKPIKWGFKFWFRCSSKSGYLYQMDIQLGREQTTEFKLGLEEEVVLQLTNDLERSFCTVYFGNFFNSPKVIEKLFQKGIYGIGAVRAKRKQMSKMIDDKQMKRGDYEFIFSDNTMACKWEGNQSVLLLSSALEGMNDILSVQWREKGSKEKFPWGCQALQ